VNAPPRPIPSRTRARRRGLTLIEVLATIVMMSIVLPAAMQGISTCLRASHEARQRSEVAALAESKLTELIATGDWQFGAVSGDFGEAWPDYRWSSGSGPWSSDSTMTEVYVRVTWTSRREEREEILTTLIYPGQTSTASAQ
jgi:prepilin-type N-terminal cleavage/methylation domain-containing protein